MSAGVDARGSAWSASTPQKTVDGPYATITSVTGRTYDVSRDGRRFLMVKEPANRAPDCVEPYEAVSDDEDSQNSRGSAKEPSDDAQRE